MDHPARRPKSAFTIASAADRRATWDAHVRELAGRRIDKARISVASAGWNVRARPGTKRTNG